MRDTGFREIADRIWLARYEWWDVNITLVGGSTGLLMVDTHASTRAARQVIETYAGSGSVASLGS